MSQLPVRNRQPDHLPLLRRRAVPPLQSRSRQESYSAPQAAARPRQSEVYQAPRAPRPAPAAQPTRSPARSRSEQRKERHLANLDTWGLLTVIFLAGIFVLELLQVILQVV